MNIPPFFSLASRDQNEAHRTATSLELMFDLAAVIAIAASAAGLHHAIASGHISEGIISFLLSFFMIWLAWVNYTWLASAYDNGSVFFNVITMFIMFGALVLAAGVPLLFDNRPIYLILIGFIIMRGGLIILWLAAARGDPNNRNGALNYVKAIIVTQLYWIVTTILIAMNPSLILPVYLIGITFELLLPIFIERDNPTNWHRQHIIERYGLLNIIVLGECFLAIVMALKPKEEALWPSWSLFELGVIASIITYTLWSLYFSNKEQIQKNELKYTFLWAYGHFVLFASGAAVGAGFAVMVETLTHHADINPHVATLSVAVPIAIYVLTIWIIRDRFWMSGIAQGVLPLSAALIILTAMIAPNPILIIALIMLITIWLRSRAATVSK